MKRLAVGPLCVFLALACPRGARADVDFVGTNFTGADSTIGERLFLETRFSKFFFTNSGGDANYQLPTNDPVMAGLETVSGSVPGPFASPAMGAMNCRQCHLVDEEGYGPFGNHRLGNRTYADFARRSPIPDLGDGRTHTPRNSPTLVEALATSATPRFMEPGFLFSPTSNYDALLPGQPPLFLHRDGQFASAHDLIIATLTGRNFGWEPSEYATAVAHIARIIRYDNGLGYLATQARGGQFSTLQPGLSAYRYVFSGYPGYVGDPRNILPFLISPAYRLNILFPKNNVTDEQILDTIADLIQVYLEGLTLSRDTNNEFDGSPYDVFLIKNGLPRQPEANETPAQYSRRLLRRVNGLARPQFVTDPADGTFTTHPQAFAFGRTELAGLKIFLAEPGPLTGRRRAGVGNCAACHPPPAFTDFIFHNTGATEEEYDAIHYPGAFRALGIPPLDVRESNYDAYLPPTPMHPRATGRFETPPTRDRPGEVDLGLWNVYANPDFPAPQAGLRLIQPALLGLPVPQIGRATLRSGRMVIEGSNGKPGGWYLVQATTNLLLPPADWAVVTSNRFDPLGQFRFNLPVPPDAGKFYTVSPALPSPAEMLPLTIGLFKTPSLRDLGHSAPYLHTGRMNTLEDVVRFYRTFSDRTRAGTVRNAAPELRDISLDAGDVVPLAAFLRSLNEDYTD